MWPFPKKSVMDPRHKDLINGNIVQLSKRTKNLKELLRCMEAAEILNLYEIAVINKANSNGQRCFKFYNRLLGKDSNTFKTLVKALLKTGNEDLAKFLWAEDDPSELSFEDESNRSQSNIENAAIGFVRARPRPQTTTSIVISVLVLILTAAIPVSLALYMFKTWIDRVFSK